MEFLMALGLVAGGVVSYFMVGCLVAAVLLWAGISVAGVVNCVLVASKAMKSL